MSHDGLKVIDSDMHIIEPADLWQRYIDPRFKDGAPAGQKTPFSARYQRESTPRDAGRACWRPAAYDQLASRIAQSHEAAGARI